MMEMSNGVSVTRTGGRLASSVSSVCLNKINILILARE